MATKDLVSGIPLVGKYFEAFGKGAGKGIEALETVSKYPDRKYGVNMFNDPQFNKYVKDVINNAKVLSEKLTERGFKIFSGGTDTHLMLIDLRSFGVTGKDAQASLGRANITCNKNGIPFDTESPMITSGIRLGTPACTTRGFGANEFKLVGDLIFKVIDGLSKNKEDNSKIEKEVQKEIIELCSSFPIYSS